MILFNYFSDIPPDFTGVYKILNTGNIYHMKGGKAHNDAGPAVIWKDGTKVWYINGLEHREDGPSTEYPNGSKEWYYKNKYYGKNNDFTVKTWKEKVKYLKLEEELEIFK